MATEPREFAGHIQAGDAESAQPWTEATVSKIGDELVVTVNQVEVARLLRPTVTDAGENDVFLIEGADQPLYFRPRDPSAFRAGLLPPMTTAERIAAASGRPADATLVMDRAPDEDGIDGGAAAAGESRSGPRLGWVAGIAAVLSIVLLVAFCGDGETGLTSTSSLPGTPTSTSGTASATTMTTSQTTSLATTTTVAPTTSTSAATTTTGAPTTTLPAPAFGSGTHVVGDIQPGIYETGIIDDPFGCYWERLSGLSGDFEDIIANGNVAGHDVVDIMEDDAAFSTDCEAWFPLTEREPPLSPIPEGKWVVGTHILAGTYTAPGGDTCYWERLSGLSGTFDDIITNDFSPGQAVVEIAEGDVAFNSADCGQWAPRT